MSQVILTENTSAPGTPSAGTVTIYPKSDGFWYSKDDAGTETPLAGMTSLTGDVTASGIGAAVSTISAGVVTNAKLADVPTATIKGRIAGGTGVPTDLTVTQVTSMLDAMVGDSGAGGTKGLVPAPAIGDSGKYLKGDGTWGTVSLVGYALTANPLSQFAATTSAQLLGVISDETGSGLVVFNNTPTLITPVLGVATATSINFGTSLVINDAANVLSLRNSTTAQTFNIYNTWANSGTDYERLAIKWASNTIDIRMEKGGTGVVRPLTFYYADGLTAINIGTSATNGISLARGTPASAQSGGIVGVRDSGSVNFTGGTHCVFATYESFAPTATSTLVAIGIKINPTINYSNGTPGAGSYEALKIAVVETALPTGTNYLIRASAGAAGTTDRFYVNNSGNVSANAFDLGVVGTNYFQVNVSGLYLRASSPIGFFTGSGASATNFFWRDTSNVLGIRDGTAAFRTRLYNTFTTVLTVGEWWKEDWITTANQFRFGTCMGTSTGTARVASWDYGGLEASPSAAITVPITSGNIVFGGGVQLSNAAVTGLVAGVLAASTNASIILYDSTGQAYRVPCII